MSFFEQEQVLFDLLFDAPLRERFEREGISALDGYGLSEQEKNDFAYVRVDALKMDAAMRSNLILAQFCRSFPLSFSLVSSFTDGIDFLTSLISSALMQSQAGARAALFGQALQAALASKKAELDASYVAVEQIIAAETQMAFISAKRKFTCLQGESLRESQIPNEWPAKKLDLADYTTALSLPNRYSELTKALCPVHGSALWAHLKKTPLPASLRDSVLADNSPHLLLAKALSRDESACDPQTRIVTAELSAGFIPIFQHINGSLCANELLAYLQHAGAEQDLLLAVKKQFQQLLQSGFLQVDGI